MENQNTPSDKEIANRKIKDTVFRDLFSDKKYLIQLYQAVHPEDKESGIADLEEVTLGQVLTYGLHNDLGFRVGDRLLILVEAQSTWSVNIIVRCMLYMANTIQEYLGDSEQSLFGSKPVHLPEPELYVLFSGDAPKIEKKEITLSEEFFGGKKTDLDVRVHVLTGENEGDIIYEYVAFTKVVNDQFAKKGYTREAIVEAIRICKDRNILREYLTSHEKEVIDIMVTLYNQEEVMKGLIASERREAREEAWEEAREETKKEDAMTIARALYKNGVSIDIIADSVGKSADTIKAWLGQTPDA